MAEVSAGIEHVRSVDWSAMVDDEVTRIVLADAGNGVPSTTVSAFKVPPGMAWRGGPTHTHPHIDQFFYVLAGTLSLEIGDKSFELGPGQLGFIPKGMPHRNWNATSEMLTYLEIVPGQLQVPPQTG